MANLPKIKRAWLIVHIIGTNKIAILKRSKTSRNPGQWGFVGGSSKKERLSPRKLIRKESHEEIGLTFSQSTMVNSLVRRNSIYYYFITNITLEQFNKLKLNYEHSRIKLINPNKLINKRRLHHSIKVYLRNNITN
jgi:8-oxo-dGTP pyrophosphatase MutT (NUDIX family)